MSVETDKHFNTVYDILLSSQICLCFMLSKAIVLWPWPQIYISTLIWHLWTYMMDKNITANIGPSVISFSFWFRRLLQHMSMSEKINKTAPEDNVAATMKKLVQCSWLLHYYSWMCWLLWPNSSDSQLPITPVFLPSIHCVKTLDGCSIFECVLNLKCWGS